MDVSRIPAEIWQKIFSCFTWREAIGLESVCWTWGDILRAGGLTRQPDNKLTISGSDSPAFGSDPSISKHSFANISILEASLPPLLPKSAFVDLIRRLLAQHRAETVSFENLVMDSELIGTLAKFRQIRVLRFEMVRFDVDCLARLPRLEVLDISNCAFQSSLELCLHPLILRGQLRELRLTHCFAISDQFAFDLARFCPKLHKLELWRTPKITIKGVSKLVETFSEKPCESRLNFWKVGCAQSEFEGRFGSEKMDRVVLSNDLSWKVVDWSEESIGDFRTPSERLIISFDAGDLDFWFDHRQICCC